MIYIVSKGSTGTILAARTLKSFNIETLRGRRSTHRHRKYQTLVSVTQLTFLSEEKLKSFTIQFWLFISVGIPQVFRRAIRYSSTNITLVSI